YHMARACLPHMRRLGRGRILNISSIGGRIGVPHLAAYSAGKFALAGWSQALRTALAHEHILVTTATPGLMRTGSHVRAVIRGRHRAEARWFGASMLTPVTSMRAPRAARQIVDACLAGRAHVTPGIQARAAEILQGVAPGAVAWAGALATRLALPHAAPGDAAASVPRRAADVGFGWIEPLLPVDPADRRVRACSLSHGESMNFDLRHLTLNASRRHRMPPTSMLRRSERLATIAIGVGLLAYGWKRRSSLGLGAQALG